MAELNTQPNWDPSQFKLQLDGTFRISIRGMAAMAGIAVSGLSQSLSSAVHENPLPCARSLVAQGFNPVHVPAHPWVSGKPAFARGPRLAAAMAVGIQGRGSIFRPGPPWAVDWGSGRSAALTGKG